MALEPITRQEQIIAGKDLEPITRMEKFLKQYGGGGSSGGGSGFEYDFIIRMSLDGGLTLENGTYASIMAKLGTLPINGKVLINFGEDVQKTDSSAVMVEYVDSKLRVYTVSFPNTTTVTPAVFVINTDNTVTMVE